MATEDRFKGAGRRFHIEESTTQNNGQKTVFIEHMGPGTAVPPHFHTRFSETFDLVSGSITVFLSTQSHDTKPDLAALESSAQQMEIGKPVTVLPKAYHNYIAGNEDTTVRVTLSPGDVDFERLLKIMNGLGEDGELEKFGESPVLMAVVMELSDAHLIGPVKGMLDGVNAEKAGEIQALRERLLTKYDTEESSRKLLAKKQ